jgi:hypothetical protein
MGLAERRKIKEIQDVTLPGRVKDIEEICGTPIPYEVDWDSFSNDLEALTWMDDISCNRLNMTLRGICRDDIGKQAVRDGLKKIKLKNVKTAAEMYIAFDGGVLEMHCAYALRGDGMFTPTQIDDVLSKNL